MSLAVKQSGNSETSRTKIAKLTETENVNMRTLTNGKKFLESLGPMYVYVYVSSVVYQKRSSIICKSCKSDVLNINRNCDDIVRQLVISWLT